VRFAFFHVLQGPGVTIDRSRDRDFSRPPSTVAITTGFERLRPDGCGLFNGQQVEQGNPILFGLAQKFQACTPGILDAFTKSCWALQSAPSG
jgi:hypothetical protein